MDDFWIILTGSLVAASCALVGSFLVLRKMAMLGDAISHAVLPGIVIAFLFTGSRDPVPMVVGAGLLGVVTSFLIETLYRRGKLQQDASIGVTFTWLFAVGVILVSLFAGRVDLDQDCVLYGEIAYVPLDTWIVDGTSYGPRAIWILGAVLVVVVIAITMGFKELQLTAFDPALATSVGISASVWHYLLMGMVSLCTVAAFESVGAILVVAMLVVPAATAYLVARSLTGMLLTATAVGIASAFGGYYLAVGVDGSISASMAVVAGVLFVVALIAAPGSSLLRRKLITIER